MCPPAAEYTRAEPRVGRPDADYLRHMARDPVALTYAWWDTTYSEEEELAEQLQRTQGESAQMCGTCVIGQWMLGTRCSVPGAVQRACH